MKPETKLARNERNRAAKIARANARKNALPEIDFPMFSFPPHLSWLNLKTKPTSGLENKNHSGHAPEHEEALAAELERSQ